MTIRPIRDMDIVEALELWWGLKVEGLQFADMARVHEFIADGPKAHIELLHRGEDRGHLFDFPILPNVPVYFPGGVDGGMSWDLQKNDLGLVVFCDRLLDAWKSIDPAGKPIDPGDEGYRHNLNNGVFFPGFWSFGRRPHTGTGLRLWWKDASVNLAANGVVEVQTAGTEKITLTPGAEVKVETAGNVTVEATGNAGVTCQGNVTVEATGNATVKSMGYTSLTADGGFEAGTLFRLVQSLITLLTAMNVDKPVGTDPSTPTHFWIAGIKAAINAAALTTLPGVKGLAP